MSDVVRVWKAELQQINAKAAEALADPADHADLFPAMEEALRAEPLQAQVLARHLPSEASVQWEGYSQRDVLNELQGLVQENGQAAGRGAAESPAIPPREVSPVNSPTEGGCMRREVGAKGLLAGTKYPNIRLLPAYCCTKAWCLL